MAFKPHILKMTVLISMSAAPLYSRDSGKAWQEAGPETAAEEFSCFYGTEEKII